jgi:hypothetical protein
MKDNSLVVYIGGQCLFGRSILPLKLNKVYTVHSTCNKLHDNGTIGEPMIYLEEMLHIKAKCGRSYAFSCFMFREIDAPRKIKLEEIIKQEVNDTYN